MSVAYKGSGLVSIGLYKERGEYWTGFKTYHKLSQVLSGMNTKDLSSWRVQKNFQKCSQISHQRAQKSVMSKYVWTHEMGAKIGLKNIPAD